MSRHFFALLCALLFAAFAQAQAPIKTVYHLNEGLEQASNALRNIGNHLSVDPSAKIVVVTHARGVDFLIDGTKDKNGNPYDIAVAELIKKGVEFRVCSFTLTSRKIDPKTLISDLKIVPSGVAEVSALQSREGFAYLRP